MRTALIIAGFLLVGGASQLQAQARDTGSTRAPAFPKAAKAKVQPAQGEAGGASAADAGIKVAVPPKTKPARPASRTDPLPAISKPPKAPRSPA